MTTMQKFRAYALENPMELDVAMCEVYTILAQDVDQFTMFDGGSHKGWHAHRMLQIENCAKVYAVEADPSIGNILVDNLTKWHTEDTPKLHIVRKALQDQASTTSIPWLSSHSHVGRSSIQSKNTDSPSIWSTHQDVQYRDDVSVPATTIDLILEADKRPLPFVKLDLEGADFLALRGASDTLKNARPVIAFENSDKAPGVHGYTLDDVSDYFNSHSYVPLDYTGQPLHKDTWFEFYEAWTVPIEKLAQTQQLISAAINKRIS